MHILDMISQPNCSECARLAMDDMGAYLDQKEGEVAVIFIIKELSINLIKKIFDATNTTRQRRRMLVPCSYIMLVNMIKILI